MLVAIWVLVSLTSQYDMSYFWFKSEQDCLTVIEKNIVPKKELSCVKVLVKEGDEYKHISSKELT